MSPEGRDFDGWYRGYHPRLIAALTVVAGTQQAAVEAADEALVRALERWGRVSGMESPEGWTYRVGVNLLRRQGRRHRQESDASARAVVPSPVMTLTPGVWDAVRALSAKQREGNRAALRPLDLDEAQTAKAMGVARSEPHPPRCTPPADAWLFSSTTT